MKVGTLGLYNGINSDKVFCVFYMLSYFYLFYSVCLYAISNYFCYFLPSTILIRHQTTTDVDRVMFLILLLQLWSNSRVTPNAPQLLQLLQSHFNCSGVASRVNRGVG